MNGKLNFKANIFVNTSLNSDAPLGRRRLNSLEEQQDQ